MCILLNIYYRNDNEYNMIMQLVGSIYLNHIRSSPNLLLLYINSIVETIPNDIKLLGLLIENCLYGFCNVYNKYNLLEKW